MEPWQAQIQRLNIPYPARRLLENEIARDLEYMSPVETLLPSKVLHDLYEIHATRMDKMLALLGQGRRDAELAITVLPLMTSVYIIFKEDVMFEFIQDGGIGMYAILGVGLCLLGRELLTGFRLVIVKNHSTENLRLDTPSVLLGCLALMFLSLGWTTLGVYRSAGAVVERHLPMDILLAGLKESLTPMIMGTLLAGIIILAHYTIRRVLVLWQAPVT